MRHLPQLLLSSRDRNLMASSHGVLESIAGGSENQMTFFDIFNLDLGQRKQVRVLKVRWHTTAGPNGGTPGLGVGFSTSSMQTFSTFCLDPHFTLIS